MVPVSVPFVRRWATLVLVLVWSLTWATAWATDHPPLGNLHQIADGVWSGASPEGAAGFTALRELGVRTIISVDGAAPLTAAARAEGLRYVHLPVGYDGIAPERAAQLARAVSELPGPFYIHCHHGLHRGPTAAVVATVGAGRLAPEAAEGLLTTCGTGRQYLGLWAAAQAARPLTAAALAAASTDFPERAPVPALVEAMVAIDTQWEDLERCRAAGWKTPADHPDLDPAQTALLLKEGLVELGRTGSQGPTWDEPLQRGIAAATALEQALRIGGDADAARKALRQSCTDCHRAQRDRR